MFATEKLGREDAERSYYESIVPAIKVRARSVDHLLLWLQVYQFSKTSPSLFPPPHHGKWYTLEAYHRAGSRILSRSFTVNRWTGEGDAEESNDEGDEAQANDAERNETEADHQPADLSLGSAMDIDHPIPRTEAHQEEQEDSGSQSDEDPSDVSMLPMADLLNARWGSENVGRCRLLHYKVLINVRKHSTMYPRRLHRSILNSFTSIMSTVAPTAMDSI